MPTRRRRGERSPQYSAPKYRELHARLGTNLRATRRARGWTQAAAAERCGMTPQQFQQIETGRTNVTLTSLARLCAGLAVDVSDLFALPPPLSRDLPVDEPLSALLDALELGAVPAPAWIVRWSVRGADPVHAAWDASAHFAALLRLLIVTGRSDDWRRAAAAVRSVEPGDPGTYAARCCAAVRAAAPRPPTLREALEVLTR